MRAVQFAEYGGPDVLRVVEVDEPHAGAGQVRIAVRAAGMNGIDWKIRAGYMGGAPLSKPGETLLVSGASGGVGSAVVQIARQRGINMIGTGSERNQDYLRSLGAVPTTYGACLVDRVRDLAPDGVDAALDIAGSGVIPELIELTGEPYKVLSIADFSAPEQGAQVSTTSTDAAGAMAEAARLFTEGTFSLSVEQTFPLEAAVEAHAASEAGHVAGRLVVTVP